MGVFDHYSELLLLVTARPHGDWTRPVPTRHAPTRGKTNLFIIIALLSFQLIVLQKRSQHSPSAHWVRLTESCHPVFNFFVTLLDQRGYHSTESQYVHHHLLSVHPPLPFTLVTTTFHSLIIRSTTNRPQDTRLLVAPCEYKN